MTPPIPWSAYACLASSMALVGSYVGLSRVLLAVFPVMLLAWLRFGIAAVAMLPWLRRGRDEPRLGARERGLLFVESLLGNVLFSVCMLYGVAWSSAVAAGVIMAAIPAAVALLSRLLLGERIAPRIAGGIACAVAGIGWLALSQAGAEASASSSAAPGSAGDRSGWGHLLLVGAVFCEASYVVIGKRLTAQVSPRRISALINLWGLALVTPAGLWLARDYDFAAVGAGTWWLLVFYALAASMITVALWMTGLRRVPASRAGVFTVLLPVTAVAVGVVVLGEPFGGAQAAALALALAGLLLATWPARG